MAWRRDCVWPDPDDEARVFVDHPAHVGVRHCGSGGVSYTNRGRHAGPTCADVPLVSGVGSSPGAPPAVAANALPSAAWARPLFVIWVAAVPTLTWGFASHNSAATNAGAGLLLCGVLTNAAYLLSMMRRLR